MPTLKELVALGQVRLVQADDVAVLTAAGGSQLLKANPMRTHLTIVNEDTANAAFITRRNKVPATTTGIRLDALGGNIDEDLEQYGKTIGDERRAIFAVGNGNLYVEEYEAYLLPGQNLVG